MTSRPIGPRSRTARKTDDAAASESCSDGAMTRWRPGVRRRAVEWLWEWEREVERTVGVLVRVRMAGLRTAPSRVCSGAASCAATTRAVREQTRGHVAGQGTGVHTRNLARLLEFFS